MIHKNLSFFGLAAMCFVAVLSATPVRANEVKLTYKGLTLNANQELAPGKSLSDGAILIVHGTLAHGGMDVIRSFQDLLKAKGWNSLAINLSYGVSNRHGMFECTNVQRHRHADALGEIDAWVKWLERQGAKSITLAGHSRGANQVAQYAINSNRASVRSLVFAPPGMMDRALAARHYEDQYKKPLQPLLSEAESLIKAGKGSTELKNKPFLNCASTTVTADSFASYYSAGAIPETAVLIMKYGKPVLVVVGSQDNIHPDVIEKVKPIADGKRVQLKVIDGADAFFRDFLAEDAVDAMTTFLVANR